MPLIQLKFNEVTHSIEEGGLPAECTTCQPLQDSARLGWQTEVLTRQIVSELRSFVSNRLILLLFCAKK